MKSWIMRTLVLAMLVVCIAGVAQAQTATALNPVASPQVAAQESKLAGQPKEAQTEANLILPDLNSVSFLGITGQKLLLFGLIVCVLGLLFGFVMYVRLKNLQVHASMR